MSDLGTININSVEDPNASNITYEVKGISGSTYTVVIKIANPNGIEKIVYKNSIGQDVILNVDNKLEVTIDYQVSTNTDYYFTVKAVGLSEKVEKIHIDTVTTIIADGSFDGTVNSPKLAQGMTGIYWDGARK
ncbi:hypothetical protein D3C72_2080630 [compost metagenome]